MSGAQRTRTRTRRAAGRASILILVLDAPTHLDLRELEFRVVGVHLADLLSRRGPQDLDDLHQLVHARIAREQRRSQQELSAHAPHRPDVDGRGVVRRPEDELGSAVVPVEREGGRVIGGMGEGGGGGATREARRNAPRANVRHVGLARLQRLGRPKVAQLDGLRHRVEQQVLRLDVTVAYSESVQLRERSAQLINVTAGRGVEGGGVG